MSLRIGIFGADIHQVLGNGSAQQLLIQTRPARTLAALRPAEVPVLGES